MRLVVGEQVVGGGAVLARDGDGRVVFVDGALPGETVEVGPLDQHRDFARAQVEGIVDPSPHRVAPPCPNATAGCGGCQWQHVDPAAQVELKELIVSDALRRIAGPAADGVVRLDAIRLPDGGYRTTARLATDDRGRLAYRRRRSRELLSVDECHVAHPRLAELIAEVRVTGWREVTLRVGVAGGQRLAVPSGPVGGARRSVGGPDDLHVVGWGGGSRVGPGGGGGVGMGWFSEEVAGRAWRVSARSFFQAGPAAAEGLVEAVDGAVGGALGPGGVLVDAYAGVGLLGGAVAARRQACLHSVESSAGAAADARHNLSDLDATVAHVEVGAWKPVPADVVVADPARPGLGRPGAAAVTAARPARIVLVSCDPASLGRDVGLLAGAGYRLSTVQLVDVFPHTVHVEAVSRFDRSH